MCESVINLLQCGTIEPGLPWWLSGKDSACQCRRCKRHGFNPWFGKIPWRRKWQPTPVFFPGKSYGQELRGYNPRGHKELDTTSRLKQQVYSPLCELGISANFVGLRDVLWGWSSFLSRGCTVLDALHGAHVPPLKAGRVWWPLLVPVCSRISPCSAVIWVCIHPLYWGPGNAQPSVLRAVLADRFLRPNSPPPSLWDIFAWLSLTPGLLPHFLLCLLPSPSAFSLCFLGDDGLYPPTLRTL